MKDKSATRAQLAKFDPVHVTAPQLFVSLSRKNKQRDTEKLLVIYTPVTEAGTATFEFHGPDRLGVDDLQVLQGLIAVGTEQGREIATSRVQKSPPKMEGNPVGFPETLVVSSSFSYLARTIGYRAPDSGETLRLIRASIERMSKVTVFFRESIDGRAVRLDSFISQYESDLSADGLQVGLNSRMTAAIFAVNRGEQYIKVHLDEVRRLKSDPARLIHHRLHFLQEGASVKIGLDTLASYVWLPTTSYDAIRKRRAAVSKALDELRSIGWKVVKTESDSVVWVIRPRVSAELGRKVPQN